MGHESLSVFFSTRRVRLAGTGKESNKILDWEDALACARHSHLSSSRGHAPLLVVRRRLRIRHPAAVHNIYAQAHPRHTDELADPHVFAEQQPAVQHGKHGDRKVSAATRVAELRWISQA